LEPFGIHRNSEGFFLLTVAHSTQFRQVPCRISCRFFSGGFQRHVERRCPLEMVVGRHQVMLQSDGRSVAAPGSHDVQRQCAGQFGFPSRSQCLKYLRPRFHVSPLDDLREHSPPVH
jgi:hypothetical protein